MIHYLLQRVVIICVCAVTLIAPQISLSQVVISGVEEAAQQNLKWIDGVVRTVANKLNAVSTQGNSEIIRSDDVLVSPDGEFVAGFNPLTRKVMISYGTFSAMGRIAEMLLDVEDDLVQTKHMDGYVKYLATVNASAIDVVLGKGSRAFNEFAGIGTFGNGKLERDSSWLVRYVELYSEGVAYLLAHEFSHRRLAHRSPADLTPEQARKQEHDADLAALDWLKSADFSGSGIILYLVIPAARQTDFRNQLVIRTRDHMHPYCRMVLGAMLSLHRDLVEARKSSNSEAEIKKLEDKVKETSVKFKNHTKVTLDEFIESSLGLCDSVVKSLLDRLLQ